MVHSDDGRYEKEETEQTLYRERGPIEDIAPKHIAPDGGWGWMVCFACFLMNVIQGGLVFSLGIVFVELIDHFQQTKANTSWILSMNFSVCYLSGPLVATLTAQFGSRAVAFVGTLVSVFSLIISIFTPNLYVLYFSLGLLFGFGSGMMYLSGIVCVSEYFDKRRALATGITVSGTGLGTFIFSPLVTLLQY